KKTYPRMEGETSEQYFNRIDSDFLSGCMHKAIEEYEKEQKEKMDKIRSKRKYDSDVYRLGMSELWNESKRMGAGKLSTKEKFKKKSKQTNFKDSLEKISKLSKEEIENDLEELNKRKEQRKKQRKSMPQNIREKLSL